MASTFYFNNKLRTLPGAYSTIVSGETNPPRTLDYGVVLIVDTGTEADGDATGYGGGSGINGELASGQDAIYSFSTLQDFRNFQKGGIFWKIAEKLFYPDPSNAGAVGISKLYYAKAATTTVATMTFETAAGGSLVINPRDEGKWANGVLTAGNLSTGYAYTIDVSPRGTPNAYVLNIWRGTYTGTAIDGLPYDDATYPETSPLQLVVQSDEFTTMIELIDWAKKSKQFNNHFRVDPTTAPAGTGQIATADLTDIGLDTSAGDTRSDFQLATGGTSVYNQADMDLLMTQITGLDHNFVFCDQVGSANGSQYIVKLIQNTIQDSKFQRFLFIGGHEDVEDFDADLSRGEALDSEWIVLVHGDAGMNSDLADAGYRWWGVLYLMAAVIGRVAGKPPQIPVTNKSIGIDRMKSTLSDYQLEDALKKGVLVVYKNSYRNKFVILQGVNTLQDNANLFNTNGQSYSIQFMRIIAQINKELVVNAEIDLLGAENGANVFTLSAGTVKMWTIAYLQSRTVQEDSDNLLLGFQNVNVTRQEDAWFVTYEIRINNEITKIFFTGFLIR